MAKWERYSYERFILRSWIETAAIVGIYLIVVAAAVLLFDLFLCKCR